MLTPFHAHRAAKRAVVAIASAAGVAVLAGGTLADLHRYFDILAHFRVQAAIGTAAMLLALFWPARALLIGTLGVLAAVLVPVALAASYLAAGTPANALSAGAFLKPAYANRASGDGVAGDAVGRFRLITFNTLNKNNDLDAIANLLTRHRPDAVVLQELSPRKYARLRAALGDGWQGVHCDDSYYCHVALLTPHAIRSHAVLGRGPGAEGPPQVRARIAFGRLQVTVIGVHIMRPISSARRHLLELQRLALQVRGIDRAGVGMRAGPPMIVAGDFNATVFSKGLQRFAVNSGLRHMGPMIPSWPVRPFWAPQIAIDHVYASPGVQVSAVAALPNAGSDHLPILADLDLAASR